MWVGGRRLLEVMQATGRRLLAHGRSPREHGKGGLSAVWILPSDITSPGHPATPGTAGLLLGTGLGRPAKPSPAGVLLGTSPSLPAKHSQARVLLGTAML